MTSNLGEKNSLDWSTCVRMRESLMANIVDIRGSTEKQIEHETARVRLNPSLLCVCVLALGMFLSAITVAHTHPYMSTEYSPLRMPIPFQHCY